MPSIDETIGDRTDVVVTHCGLAHAGDLAVGLNGLQCPFMMEPERGDERWCTHPRTHGRALSMNDEELPPGWCALRSSVASIGLAKR